LIQQNDNSGKNQQPDIFIPQHIFNFIRIVLVLVLV